jgi:hypothetical protein
VEIFHLEFSEADVDALKADLGAKLDSYLGRSATPSDIDTLRLSKSLECDDLADVQMFKDFSEDFETASADLMFPTPGSGTVRLRVSTVNGAIWIVGTAPESVIDRIFDAVRTVKALP